MLSETESVRFRTILEKRAVTVVELKKEYNVTHKFSNVLLQILGI